MLGMEMQQDEDSKVLVIDILLLRIMFEWIEEWLQPEPQRLT